MGGEKGGKMVGEGRTLWTGHGESAYANGVALLGEKKVTKRLANI